MAVGKTVPSKLSKTNVALVCFTLLLVLSVYGLVILNSVYHQAYQIHTTRLIDKPSSYFALNGTDRYVLEAISKKHSSTFNSLDRTQIDELIDQYGTSAIEYNGAYYQIIMSYGVSFPPVELSLAIFTGIITSASAIAIFCLPKATVYLKQHDNRLIKIGAIGFKKITAILLTFAIIGIFLMIVGEMMALDYGPRFIFTDIGEGAGRWTMPKEPNYSYGNTILSAGILILLSSLISIITASTYHLLQKNNRTKQKPT